MDLLSTVVSAILLLAGVAFCFQATGEIKMENSTDLLPQVSTGDTFLFTFSVNLEQLLSNERVLISIDGDMLEFNNDSYIDAVTWFLSENAANQTYSRDSPELDTREAIYEPMNRQDCSLGYLLNITSGLHKESWTFSGSFKMSVTDDVTAGSLIRSVMTLTVLWATGQETTITTVVSKYHMIQMPQVTVKATSPLTQPILGLFTAQIGINSPRLLRNCTVQVYTSPESKSKEVRLTVQTLSVSTIDTSGTTADAMNDLKGISSKKSSSLGSYQNNMANMVLPRIPLDVGNFSEVKVVSDFMVRVEDYSELKNGDQWPVFLGASFSGNLIWVGSILVNISAPVIRQPDLEVGVNQLKQCAYNGNSTAVLQVLVKHSAVSTGTAYNVTVNLYLAGYMNMSRNVYTQPLENTIKVWQNTTVVVAEIARLTFSDPFTLEVTLDLDLSDLQNLVASNRVVTVEAVYGDRWGNVTDNLSNTSYVSVDVSRTCSKRLTWTTSSTCTCDYDPNLTTCGCCVPNATKCGLVRPQACAPKTERWRCVSYKEGFEKLQYLQKNNFTEAIRCDAFHMRRGSATGVSCHKILSSSPAKYLELSPRVAVVTGINTATGFLYGISNNGLAYVISKDGGNTWTSIRDDVYTNVASEPQFIRSTIM